jgi:hypothetical protein
MSKPRDEDKAMTTKDVWVCNCHEAMSACDCEVQAGMECLYCGRTNRDTEKALHSRGEGPAPMAMAILDIARGYITAECDKWKRQIEAAESRSRYAITITTNSLATDAIPSIPRSGSCDPESGPGIAAMPKPDDTLDQATLADLLADDAG